MIILGPWEKWRPSDTSYFDKDLFRYIYKDGGVSYAHASISQSCSVILHTECYGYIPGRMLGPFQTIELAMEACDKALIETGCYILLTEKQMETFDLLS